MSSYHTPVLVEEVINGLRCQPGGVFVDGTLGGGGHALRIMEAIGPTGLLIGLDKDGDAIQESRKVLAPFGTRAILRKADFSTLSHVLLSLGISEVNGILLDLGVSSHQLDEVERGFSFHSDHRLDMRMDREQEVSAYNFINQAPEEELRRIIWKYGEERMARRIAKYIVRAREKEPVRTTLSLANVVMRACSLSERTSKIHPATRTFQAIRIWVNNELDNLECAITSGMDSLRSKGRFCIVSFHSLEDRIVKNAFRSWARTCVCPPDLPVCVCHRRQKMNVLTRKPILPKAEEISANPRARSARLRIAERI